MRKKRSKKEIQSSIDFTDSLIKWCINRKKKISTLELRQWRKNLVEELESYKK